MIISLNQSSDISVALVFLTRDEIRSKYLEMKISCPFLIVLLLSKTKVSNGSLAREFPSKTGIGPLFPETQTC